MNRGLHKEPNNPLKFQLKTETSQNFCTTAFYQTPTDFTVIIIDLVHRNHGNKNTQRPRYHFNATVIDDIRLYRVSQKGNLLLTTVGSVSDYLLCC